MQLACASTTSGKILEQAKKSENTGVFFLDICLQSEMTGLILAQELRKIQPRCFIIFRPRTNVLLLSTSESFAPS